MKRLTALLLVFAVACGTESVEPLGRDYYALASIKGVALPAPYSPNPDYNGLLVADSMAFREDGTGLRRTVYQEEGSTQRWSTENSFTFQRDGDRIVIELECPMLAPCFAGPHLIGTVAEGEITITESKVTRFPLVYKRSGIERLEARGKRGR